MTERQGSLDRIVIGLTGPIAAGKSTVASMLRERGAEIIDADEVYRSLLTRGSTLTDQVIARFGSTVRLPDGQVDRGELGKIVFGDPAALSDLERLTHPAVVTEIRRRIGQSRAPVVVIEAIRLMQSGLGDDIDRLWFVDARPEVRLRRLVERANLDRETAEQRLAVATVPLSRGVQVDAIIDTSGDLDTTARAVAAAWDTLGVAPASPGEGALVTTNQRGEC
jgi:dephospho-CoA kinase